MARKKPRDDGDTWAPAPIFTEATYTPETGELATLTLTKELRQRGGDALLRADILGDVLGTLTAEYNHAVGHIFKSLADEQGRAPRERVSKDDHNLAPHLMAVERLIRALLVELAPTEREVVLGSILNDHFDQIDHFPRFRIWLRMLDDAVSLARPGS